MSAEELENFETGLELQLYQEYRDVAKLFRFVVETDRRFYLANSVRVEPVHTGGTLYFDVELKDAWVWDVYRSARFVKNVRVLSVEDVNVEELAHADPFAVPGAGPAGGDGPESPAGL